MKKKRFALLKRLIGLAYQKAPLNQYFLEIGAHFIKKGTGYKVGQIIEQKHLREDLFRVKVISGLYYDFAQNKVVHTSEKKIITAQLAKPKQSTK